MSSSTSLLSIMWKCLISQLLESSWVWPTMPQCCQQANAPSRLLRSAAFMKHEGLGPNTQRWMSSLGFANRALSVFTSNPFWPKFLTARQDPPLTLKNDGEPGGTSEEISFSMRWLCVFKRCHRRSQHKQLMDLLPDILCKPLTTC